MTETHPQGGAALRASQDSSILKMLWIGFYSAILYVLTLSIFQFWARTQARRQIWKDTALDGEQLEYTGKGSELLVGFLLAMLAVTLGLGVIFGLPALAYYLGGPVAGVGLGVVAGLLYFAAMIILPGAAVFLARRYLLSRTTYRGVRFEQTGSAVRFGLASFGYGLLNFFTLGIFAPIARLRLAEMLWDKAKYGDRPFRFDGNVGSRTEPVWGSFLLSYFGNIAVLVVLFGGFFALGMFDPENTQDPTFMLTVLPQLLGIYVGAILVAVALLSWHEAVMIRQTIKLISLDGLKLSSDLSTWNLMVVYFTNVLLVVFTLGFGLLAAEMRIWRVIARSLSADGAIDFAAIAQSVSRGPSQGEGLAQAFDIGGGVV